MFPVIQFVVSIIPRFLTLLTVPIILNNSAQCYKINVFRLFTLYPDNLKVQNMSPLNKSGGLLMGCFKNRQGLLIRTYASRVNNPRAHIILVHGIRSHFRAEYCSYNVDWYMKYVAEYVNTSGQQVFNKELEDIFPNLNEHVSKNSNQYQNKINGMDAFEITPRFKYEGSFVQALNNMNFSVYGLDLQSHGLSAGICDQRCFVKSFDDLVYDVIQFVSIVKRGQFENGNEEWNEGLVYSDERHDPKEYHLCGLSMGGNIVLKAQDLFNIKSKGGIKFVDGIIGMGAMLNIDHYFSGISGLLLPLVRILAKIAPKMTLPMESKDGWADGLNTCLRYNDPLFFRNRLPCRMVVSVYDATKDLRKLMTYYPKDLPTLFIHSTDDPTCSVKGPREFIDIFFKNSRHSKLFELDGRTHAISIPTYTSTVFPILENWFKSLNKEATLNHVIE